MTVSLKPPFTEGAARAKVELAEDRIAVQFQFKYRTDAGSPFRAHGLEHWVFAEDGRMQTRTASINDLPIGADDRTLPFMQGATS